MALKGFTVERGRLIRNDFQGYNLFWSTSANPIEPSTYSYNYWMLRSNGPAVVGPGYQGYDPSKQEVVTLTCQFGLSIKDNDGKRGTVHLTANKHFENSRICRHDPSGNGFFCEISLEERKEDEPIGLDGIKGFENGSGDKKKR